MRTIKRDIVGAFIFSNDNQLLLGKTSVYQGMWVVPGGGVDQNETHENALIREIIEEVGIDLSKYKLKEMPSTVTGQSEKVLRDTGESVNVEMTFYNYVINIGKPANKIKPTPSDDLTHAKFFPVTDLKKIKLSPPTVTSLQKLGYL